MKPLIPFVLFITLIACTKKEAATYYYPPTPVTGAVKTWLALGDSYTIGQSVTEAERFAAQTANMLRQNGINISTPTYIATTGWTTNNLDAAIAQQNPINHTVVSLLIGVNDQYQRHDTTGYRQRFTSLLEKAIVLANNKKENVFVLSIPDYSVTPFAAGNDTAQIRKEIDWFNAINKAVTINYNCPYVDITPSTREGLYNRSLISGDGLHPSGLGYKRWADLLAPIMLPVLK
jgi:lysophospholipase L1-like esterase